MGKGIFDLEKNFAQYGAYHNNKTNIIIHTIFVWPILFTTLLLLYFTPPFIPIPPLLATALPFSLGNILLLNFGFVSVIIYAFFYICLDVVSGTLASILLVACWVGSSILGDALEFSLAWKVLFLIISHNLNCCSKFLMVYKTNIEHRSQFSNMMIFR